MNSKPLESLHIHQFRGIQDLELKDLGQFNLFVGVNNSGKTSVLEAISLYCNPLDLREWIGISRQRDRDTKEHNRISMLHALVLLFPMKNNFSDGQISIKSQGNYIVRNLTAICNAREAIKNDREISGIELDIKSEVDTHNQDNLNPIYSISFMLWEDEELTILNNDIWLQVLHRTIAPYSHRTDGFATRSLTDVSMQGLKDDLIKMLQSLDQGIKDLELLMPSGMMLRSFPIIYIKHKQKGLIPLSIFGDGVRRLVFIALQLIQLKDGILLIDEIETAIHTEALEDAFKWIVKWCKELNIQVFATTHSLEAVDAILSVTESDDDLVLYRLEPKDNKTSALRIGRDRLQRLREDLGREVRW